jgi:hypothetical protein
MPTFHTCWPSCRVAFDAFRSADSRLLRRKERTQFVDKQCAAPLHLGSSAPNRMERRCLLRSLEGTPTCCNWTDSAISGSGMILLTVPEASKAASGTYLRVHCRAFGSSILRNNIEPRRPVRQRAEVKLHPCGTVMPAFFTGLGLLRGPFFPSTGCEPLSITALACRVWYVIRFGKGHLCLPAIF